MTVHYQSVLSTEYVLIQATATDLGTTIDPTDTEIEVAFSPQWTDPEQDDWREAEWETHADGSHHARILVGPDADTVLEPGIWQPWIRITDLPEKVVRMTGTLVIEGQTQGS